MASLDISPYAPGYIVPDADGIARWDTVLTSFIGGAVEWVVMSPDNVFRSGWNLLTGTAGGAPLTVPFVASGDYLLCRIPGDDFTATPSWRVTFAVPDTPEEPEPPERDILLSSTAPGQIQANADGTAPWSVIVTTLGMDAVEWAIFTAGNWARSGWNWLGGTAAGARLNLQFREDGDYLQLRAVGDNSVLTYALPVTILPYSGGPVEPEISIDPWRPGTLPGSTNGIARWPTTITTIGLGDTAEWVVMTGGNVARTGWNRLTGTIAGAPLTVPFQATGDYLAVQQEGGGITALSDRVTIEGTEEAVRSLAFDTRDPGTLEGDGDDGGASWSFSIESAGISELSYVVMEFGSWVWLTGARTIPADASGSTFITARMYGNTVVKVWDAADPGYAVSSEVPTILPPGWRGKAEVLCTARGTLSGGTVTNPALSRARAFLRGCVLGVNPERTWAWSIPGGVAAYAAYLKARGITHVRLFYPWRPAYGMDGPGSENVPTQAQFARILDAVAVYIAAGIKVFLDFTDVLTVWEDFSETGTPKIYQHIRNAAAWTAARRFDPLMFACGPVNEWGGDEDFLTHMLAFHQILRDAMPDHVLLLSNRYWAHWTRLISQRAYIDDRQVVWCFHSYDGQDKAGWQDTARRLTVWSNDNGGVPVAWGECGPGDARDPSGWADFMGAMHPAMAFTRPMLWAVTYGGDFRLNGADAAFRPEMLSLLPGLIAQIAAAVAPLDVVVPDQPGGGEEPGGGDPGGEEPGGGPVVWIPVPLPLVPALLPLFGTDPSTAEGKVDVRPALAATVQNLNMLKSMLAKVMALAPAAFPGPYADDAAAAASNQVEPGGFYVSTDGVVRKRMDQVAPVS